MASTLKPSGGLILPSMAVHTPEAQQTQQTQQVIPQWSRPDDAERQARLDAMKRRATGLPIPHTAIVATRKERIGQILGNFVQNHFLSRDVIAANLRQVHPAERAARWLADREHARQFSRQFAGGLAKTLANLPANELQDLVSQVVRNRVRTFRVAPALGKTLALALADNRQ